MSATNVVRAGKRGNICVGNNVSATMCPRLSGPLGNFTVVCAVTWPLNGSEAGGDLVLIQTFLGHYWKCLELALGLEPENQIVAVEIRKSKGV